jgi:hypothetical protein
MGLPPWAIDGVAVQAGGRKRGAAAIETRLTAQLA